jgi:hypothetical protein
MNTSTHALALIAPKARAFEFLGNAMPTATAEACATVRQWEPTSRFDPKWKCNERVPVL